VNATIDSEKYSMSFPCRLAFAILTCLLPVCAQTMEAEQQALLEETRTAALNYAKSLPDFLCTQTVSRSEDIRSQNRWRLIDRLTIKLSYSGGTEDYKLTQINGKPTNLSLMESGGAVSTGEFGSRMAAIFDARTHTEFRWAGWSTLRKLRVARFAYQVDGQHTGYLLEYGAPNDRDHKSTTAPYHGEILVDPDTHMVMRLTQTAEVPKNFPITHNDCWVEYDYAGVAGKRYLLPSRAFTRMRSGVYTTENNIQFVDYRKFQTETSISFDDK